MHSLRQLYQSNRFRYSLFLLAGVAAVLSLGMGWRAALFESKDFQWSPAVLFWKGINPYQRFLDGAFGDFLHTQLPNYGHVIYWLLWPLTLLDWPSAKVAWASINVALLIASIVILLRELPAALRPTFLIAALLACASAPLRAAIGNGQYSMMCLFAVAGCYVFRARPLLCGIMLALLLAKYSFGLQVAMTLLIIGRWRAVLWAAVISVIAWMSFAWRTGTPVFEALVQPLLVSKSGTAIGYFDLMSLGRLISDSGPYTSIPPLVGVLVCNIVFYVMLFFDHRSASDVPGSDAEAVRVAGWLGATVLLSLGTLYHLVHDLSALLFVAFAWLLSSSVGRSRYWIAFGIPFALYAAAPGMLGLGTWPTPLGEIQVFAHAALLIAGALLWLRKGGARAQSFAPA